jgi:hypothetical protein
MLGSQTKLVHKERSRRQEDRKPETNDVSEQPRTDADFPFIAGRKIDRMMQVACGRIGDETSRIAALLGEASWSVYAVGACIGLH